ncbi:MAG: pseudouridine synthase [Candidatus Brocadiales bacterium]
MERLQKILANAGVGSRRHCEELIATGHVTVNGKVVKKMGVTVDPVRSDVRCDGLRVSHEKKVYYLLNKPKGVVCSSRDELGRPGAIDLLKDVPQRVYTAGRLDEDSEGLIIITNDGDLTNLLCHPRHGVTKTYRVDVGGRVDEVTVKRALGRGVWLSEGKTLPARVRIIRRGNNNTVLEITLREGRNREVRRMLAALDLPVRSLKRIKIGWLSDPRLKPGKYRRLSSDEVSRFYSAPGAKRSSRSDYRMGKK